MDYRSAGVDIEAGYKSVRLMKQFVARTMRPEVMTDLGGFSGAFSMDAVKGMEHPTLLSGTDGVGTKLKLAFVMDRHDTVGIDCVAMCVNDVACAGGEPLFFLDYIACGKNNPEKIAKIVSGVAEGCVQSGSALIGGETAEMPGFYPENEYDLAGFSVGVADKKDLITGADIRPGDVLVGIASSGVHSNGFSLVRSVFSCDEIKGCSHVTGGGFYENVPRMLPDGVKAVIRKDSYEVPPIFRLLQKEGEISGKIMYNTFNMGIGMVLALDPKDADAAIEAVGRAGERAYVIGTVEESSQKCAEVI